MASANESDYQNDQWATVELMGHAQTAGRISRPSDWGGLLRVDVPLEDGDFRTEFYGMASIYAIKLVSEEIARAYATPVRSAYVYDAPIVTREQHQSAVNRLEQQNTRLQREINELERRLIAVSALPASTSDDGSDW